MTKIALVGHPNSGKTTIFNHLTKTQQKNVVASFAKLERNEGNLWGNTAIQIIDIPGISSFMGYSPEEELCRDCLLCEDIDVLVNVIDARELEKQLYLTTQLMELEIPMLIVMNKIDTLQQRLNIALLEKQLSLPILTMTDVLHMETVKLATCILQKALLPTAILFSPPLENTMQRIQIMLKDTISNAQLVRYTAIKLVEEDEYILEQAQLPTDKKQMIQQYVEEARELESDALIHQERLQYASSVIKKVVQVQQLCSVSSQKVDRVLAHSWFSIPIFLSILLLLYEVSYQLVQQVSTWFVVEDILKQLEKILTQLEIHATVTSLLVDGIARGGLFLAQFLPSLLVFSILLMLLEESHYLARIEQVCRAFFQSVGISDVLVIPFLIGESRSHTAIHYERLMENRLERQLLVITNSFLPCGMKLPTIILIVNFVLGQPAYIALILYIIGCISIACSIIFLHKLLGMTNGVLLPMAVLPNYCVPSAKKIRDYFYFKVYLFIKDTVPILFISSCLLWFLSNFTLELNLTKDIKISILAHISRWLIPLFQPLGINDWNVIVVLIQGYFAKEGIISSLHILNLSFTSVTLEGMLSMLSFALINMLCIPYTTRISDKHYHLNERRLVGVVILYQLAFTYGVSFLVHQLMRLCFMGIEDVEVLLAIIITIVIVLIMVSPYSIQFFFRKDGDRK